MGRLDVVGGSTHGVRVGETRLGRDPDTCDIVLGQPSISRIHAIIEVSVWPARRGSRIRPDPNHFAGSKVETRDSDRVRIRIHEKK